MIKQIQKLDTLPFQEENNPKTFKNVKILPLIFVFQFERSLWKQNHISHFKDKLFFEKNARMTVMQG